MQKTPQNQAFLGCPARLQKQSGRAEVPARPDLQCFYARQARDSGGFGA
jgi:hypothetical protein